MKSATALRLLERGGREEPTTRDAYLRACLDAARARYAAVMCTLS
jgi:hypothetical protein